MTISKADLDRAFSLLEDLDLELGAIVGRTPEASLARVAAVGLHCDVGNLFARLSDFRARHASASAAVTECQRERGDFEAKPGRAPDVARVYRFEVVRVPEGREPGAGDVVDRFRALPDALTAAAGRSAMGTPHTVHDAKLGTWGALEADHVGNGSGVPGFARPRPSARAERPDRGPGR